MADDEQRVRQLAYRIWESEGRPEGQEQRHWDMAWKIVAAERAAGHEAEFDALDAPHDEAPILEEDLPLEEDEIGIQENRLPLDDPDGDPGIEESPYRDDSAADAPAGEVPVHDRATDAPAAPKKARAGKASSRAPSKATAKTAPKTSAKTATSKTGATTRKSPATPKSTNTETVKPEMTKSETSKKRTRPASRDKTPKPGDE